MYDVIVIGGGPAGMMAAITAARNKRKVLLIEQNKNLGKKLLLTGGGRCNITNNKSVDLFLKNIPINSNYIKPALYNFAPLDIIKFLHKNNLKTIEEDDNKVYPITEKASSVLEILENQLNKFKVEIHLNEKVTKIYDLNIITNKGNYSAKKIIVAIGGVSYPKTGSCKENFNLIKDTTTPLYPAETFIILKENLNLSGISLKEVNLKYNNKNYSGSILFTHRGISGPATFLVSEHVYKNLENVNKIYLDFIPNRELIIDTDSNIEVKTYLKSILPEKIVILILNLLKINLHKKLSSLDKTEIRLIKEKIHNFELEVLKTGSLEEAFVTGGGVDFKYIDRQTLESKKNPNIFYAGEVLDVHGPIGGYNLTIALATGYTAGKSV